MKFVLAIDVGATNLRVGIFTPRGRLVRAKSVDTPKCGGQDAVALKAVDLTISLLKEIGASRSDLMAVGVGTIGPLDIRKGDVVGTPNNPLRNFRLKRPLTEELDVPTYVVNDCMAAVWGEYKAGAGVGFENVVYITISTGIGAGAVVDGHLLIGKDGNAHEVGHIVIDYHSDVVCGCGARGHWEALASGNNLIRFAKHLASVWKGPKCKGLMAVLKGIATPPDIFHFWREDDPFAREVISELIEIDAAGIASVINVYDPEVLTVGGSVALRNQDFLEEVFKRVDAYLLNRRPEKMMPTPLQDNVVLVGAAWIALDTPKHLKRIQKG